MNVGAAAAVRLLDARPIGPTVAIGFGLVMLGFLFQSEVSAAVNVWCSSTAYNHCFLVIPIVFYLLCDRRATLRGTWPIPYPLASIAGLPLAVAWLIAERVGVMEGRQLVAMSFAQLLFFVALGPRLWWMIAGPLLFLYFLVPFGAFLTSTLQDITTTFVAHGLPSLHIPVYVTGHTIEIPEGTFLIARACAGLRFLLAAIAFGCFYALLVYRSLLRRVVFIGISIVVPVLANGVRALGIVAVSHYIGSVEAVEADHVLYGWIFFSIVILILILLGLPFRQDQSPQPRPASPRLPQSANHLWPALIGTASVVVLAAAGPTTAMQLDRRSGPDSIVAMPRLNPASECASHPMPLTMAFGAPGQMIVQQFDCEQGPVTLAIEVFPPRSTAAQLAAEQRRLAGGMVWEDVETHPIPVSGGSWRLRKVLKPPYVVATSIWVDGRTASLDLMVRVRQAWHSIRGGSSRPVLMVLIADSNLPRGDTVDAEQTAARLVGFVRTHPALSALASQLADVKE
ncbi:MAG TPA: exosortase A [Acetobacteraceae bacterium]|nr:exosortase A [Acetobacteraceae bacterium]